MGIAQMMHLMLVFTGLMLGILRGATYGFPHGIVPGLEWMVIGGLAGIVLGSLLGLVTAIVIEAPMGLLDWVMNHKKARLSQERRQRYFARLAAERAEAAAAPSGEAS